MNACGFDWQAHCRLSSHANSVEFLPGYTHLDSILHQLVRNAAMTMILTLPLCTAVRDGGSRPHPHGHAIAESARGSFHIPASWRDRARDLAPCVECGHGDNSSQHWARLCIVPVLVANVLSPAPNPVKSLDQLARVNTAGCVIASHIPAISSARLLLEHGGMQHAPSSVPLSVPEWLTRLHDNALQAIPTRFLPELVSPRQTPECRCRLPKPSLLHANRRQRSSYSPLRSTS